MSQSDYIRRKRVANQLLEPKKQPSVLNSGSYMDYKEFALENTLASVSTKNPYESVGIFNLGIKSTSHCPGFILCSGTNARLNRVKRSLAPVAPLAIVKPHKTCDKLPICQYC